MGPKNHPFKERKTPDKIFVVLKKFENKSKKKKQAGAEFGQAQQLVFSNLGLVWFLLSKTG